MHNIYSLYAENENIIGTKPLSIVDRLVCRQRQPKHYTPQLANLQITTMFEFSFALLLERHTHTWTIQRARFIYLLHTRTLWSSLKMCNGRLFCACLLLLLLSSFERTLGTMCVVVGVRTRCSNIYPFVCVVVVVRPSHFAPQTIATPTKLKTGLDTRVQHKHTHTIGASDHLNLLFALICGGRWSSFRWRMEKSIRWALIFKWQISDGRFKYGRDFCAFVRLWVRRKNVQ